MSLWDNIRKRRAAGKPKLKPGDKNYPKTLKVEDAPTMNTGAIPDPKATAMGPRYKTQTVTDRRRKKEMILLKRFRKYMEDNG
ncbi:MAG: hypothetical protein ACPHIU_03405 [Candidatus Actinomarina sp.]